jgi:hypothetical protein
MPASSPSADFLSRSSPSESRDALRDALAGRHGRPVALLRELAATLSPERFQREKLVEGTA